MSVACLVDLLFVVRQLVVACLVFRYFVFFLMIRRPPRSTQSRSSAASDVYKRQIPNRGGYKTTPSMVAVTEAGKRLVGHIAKRQAITLSLIHISEPTRPY